MKKHVIKATALAIGALVGGSAVAAIAPGVDFDAASPTVKKYAKELTYNDAAPLASTAATSFKTKIGFGVSDTQTRYIRIDYANATLDAAHAAVAATDIEIADNAAGDDAFAVVQGGAIGDNYVIYQVTAGADYASSAVVDVLVPALRVTSTASPVTVTYSLHETAVSAVAGASGTAKLYSKEQNIATFATGLSFAVDTKPTTTASVEKSFKEFKTGGGYIAVDTVKLGSISFGVDATVLENDGSAVDIGDLVAAGTKIVLAGDTSIPAGADDAAKKNSVFISSDADCAGVGLASNTVPSASGAEFVIDTNTYATKGICYVVNGTSAIPTSTYTVAVDVTAATGTSTADISATTFGEIDRDGTELHAPFSTIYSGTGNRAVLTSTHTADANVAASVITEDGVTCTAGTSSFTLKAGKQLFINASDVCPSLSTGTRFALKFIIAAPNSKIYGVYNSYTYDAATAKVTDLASYPLQRPAN